MVTVTFAAALLLGFAAAQTHGNDDVNGGGSGPSASGSHDGGGNEGLLIGSGSGPSASGSHDGGGNEGLLIGSGSGPSASGGHDGEGNEGLLIGSGSGPSASGGHDGGGDEDLLMGSGDPEPCSPDSDKVSAFLEPMAVDDICMTTLIAGFYDADFATNLETLCGCVGQASVDSMPDCEVDGVVFDADLHHQCMLMHPGQGSGSSIGDSDSDDPQSGDLEVSPTAAPWHQTKSPTPATPAPAAPTPSPTAAPWHQTKSPSAVPSPTAVPNQYRYQWSRAPTPFILEFDDDFGLGLPVGSGPSNAQNDEDGKGGAFVVFIVLLVAASVFLSTAVAVRKYRKKDVGSADVASEFASQPAYDAANATTTDVTTKSTIPVVNPAYDTPLSYRADGAAEPVYSRADPACDQGNAAAAEPVYDVGAARGSVGYDMVDARGSVLYDIGAARGSVVYDIGAARGSVVYDLGSSENAISEEDVEDGVPVSRMTTHTSFSSAITDWGDDEAAGQAYENCLTDETDKWQDADGLPLRGRTVLQKNNSLSDDDNDPAQAWDLGVVRRESMV